MKKLVFFIVSLLFLSCIQKRTPTDTEDSTNNALDTSGVSSCYCSFEDDRIVAVPPQDSILERLTLACKKQSDMKRDPDRDSNYYKTYNMTFNYYVSNDTVKVMVMGSYNHAYVFHDSYGGEDRFAGYFKRNNSFYFFYNDIFQENSRCNELKAIHYIMEGWRIRNPSENPDFFPQEMAEQDPYIFEYMIDTNGNYILIRKGYW